MLLFSLLVSIILTIVLNLAVRAFPNAADRGMRRIDGWAESQSQVQRSDHRARVFFPWKAMLIASIAGTILLNLLTRAR